MLRSVLPVALVALLALAGCDATGTTGQAQFETEAFFTTPDGVDSTDWRVGPAFDARIQVQRRPDPNPAFSRETVTMQLYAPTAPAGFGLYRLEADGRLFLVDDAPGQSGPSFYTFSFFASEVSATGLSGVYRLIVLDGRDRVVTFGDFELRG